METSVLIVEDELSIAELLNYTVQETGRHATVVHNTAEAWRCIEQSAPELVLLDWMLPGQDGLSLLGRIRRHHALHALPVIMLTAKGMEENKIEAFEAGADDYLTKPFSPRELSARINALLRRKGPEHAPTILTAGGVSLDSIGHFVTVNAQPIDIGPTEFGLLQFFLSYPNRAFSRNEILDKVWGRNVIIDERTVDVHVMRLRKALGEAQILIKTIRSVGYMLTER